jgi:hypothetical protein
MSTSTQRAERREQTRAVGEYLLALELHKPKRGRKRDAETIEKRLDAITKQMDTARGISKVALIQERLDLESELERLTLDSNLDSLEVRFVEVVKPFSERKGITRQAWRTIGVPRDVLKQAGL